jgi:hypothetical protein
MFLRVETLVTVLTMTSGTGLATNDWIRRQAAAQIRSGGYHARRMPL